MAEQFYIDLKQIPDEQSAKTIGQILLQCLVVNDVLKKQVGKDFLSKCQRNLQDQKASPQLKFYTLSIFRFLDLKNKATLKVFSMLTGHPIFAYFIETAKKVDPKKSVSEKGKNLFPKSKQLGNKFMRLLLESLKFWNQRFPSNSQQQPTKFKKSFTDLQKDGVTFPSSYNYYGPLGGTAEQKGEKFTPGQNPNKYLKSQVNEKQKKVQTAQGSAPTSQQKVTKSSIMLLFNKIQSFISFLEESQSVDELLKEATKNHKMFEKQQKRLQNSNVLSIEDQKIVSLYLKISEFFHAEKQIFEEWIEKQDSLKMYVQSLFIKYDGIFAEELADQNQEKPQKNKQQAPSKDSKPSIKIEQKVEGKNIYNSTTSNKENSKQEKKKYDSISTDKQRPSKVRKQQNDQDEPRQKLKEKKQNGQTDQIKDKNLRSFFNSHLQRPVNKSVSGFKAIKQSIQKQKKQLKGKVRGKSPINSMSKSKFNASTVSKIQTNSIFAKPPNTNVKSKRYEGVFVSSNYQLENITNDIQKQQGMKRFKISNLKNRALLYQSQHIQVGYKSEPIYQKVQQMGKNAEMIQLELFIGNKSKDQIQDLEVTFQGDQKSLVYSNPQKAPQIIKAGQQCAFTVIIIPCAQIYSMTSMNISYKFNSYPNRSVCILPSSILKFVSYEKADIRDMNQFERTQAIKCYQTQRFSLSHYFPPKKLQHYIEELSEITNYSEFAENGSEKDYVLGAFLMVKNKYSGLMKINVRPDLGVIIQLMSDNESEEAQSQFKLYIQTLWLVLKEHR